MMLHSTEQHTFPDTEFSNVWLASAQVGDAGSGLTPPPGLLVLRQGKNETISNPQKFLDCPSENTLKDSLSNLTTQRKGPKRMLFSPVSQEPLSDELFLEEPFGDETKPYFKHILLPNPDCLPFFIKTCILFHRKSLCIRLKHARETFSRSKPRKTHFQLHRHTHTHIPPNTPQRSNTTQKRPEIPKPRKSCRCIFLAKMLFSRGEKIFCTPELHHKCLYRRRSFERRSQGHGQDLHLVQGFTLETINICYTTPSSQRLAWTNNLPCACVDMKTWTDATVLSKKKREHS